MSSDSIEPKFPWEQAFARSMAASREAQGYSQNEFARRLRERGLLFHQATVQRVESLERSVRLDEAFVIAAELGLSLERMVQDSSELARSTMQQTYAAIKVSEKSYREVARLRREAIKVKWDLGALVERLASEPAIDVSVSAINRLGWIDRNLQKLVMQLTTAMNTSRGIAELAGHHDDGPSDAEMNEFLDGEH